MLSRMHEIAEFLLALTIAGLVGWGLSKLCGWWRGGRCW